MNAVARRAGEDARGFRTALGAFATGVTIVTTRDVDGADVGLTANSFNSVSLEPPMVLWSLAKSSLSLPAFMRSEHFAVHVLAADQQAISDRFARRGEDKFAGPPIGRGLGGVPLLDGCSSCFQCRTVFRYEGGDHVILVGEVAVFDHTSRAPLVFHGGGYGVVVRRPKPPIAVPEPDQGGSERRRLLTYLLSAAHELIVSDIRREYVQHGLSDEAYFALMALEMEDRQPVADLLALIGSTGRAVTPALIDGLTADGLVARAGGIASLTEAGRELAVRFFAMTKAVEAEATHELEEGEHLLLQHLLRKVIRRRVRAAQA